MFAPQLYNWHAGPSKTGKPLQAWKVIMIEREPSNHIATYTYIYTGMFLNVYRGGSICEKRANKIRPRLAPKAVDMRANRGQLKSHFLCLRMVSWNWNLYLFVRPTHCQQQQQQQRCEILPLPNHITPVPPTPTTHPWLTLIYQWRTAGIPMAE